MAPIFDSGNSMFWNNPRKPEWDELTIVEINSFRSRESQLLDYVTVPELLDIGKLPSIEELQAVYSMDKLIVPLDSILLGYQKKVRLLQDRFFA